MNSFEPKRILVPVDLSKQSENVLKWTQMFATKFGSQVEVLHADWVEEPRYFTEAQVPDLAQEAEQRRLALQRELSHLAERVFGNSELCHITVKEGHAVQVIMQQVEQLPPDMLILGSHGRSGVARLMMGSVTENIVREAHVPILIVKGHEFALEQSGPRRILCPINFTEVSRQSAELAASISSTFGAELVVMQTIEQQGANHDEIHQKLCEWIPESARMHCNVLEMVVHGNPAEQIVKFAGEHEIDLVVLGAEHRPFLEFSTLGRTTERVMRHSDSSVLLVPRSA